MDFRLHRQAPLLISLWLALPGAVVCPFVLWQSLAAGLTLTAVWLVLALGIGCSVGFSLRGSARAGQLHIRSGVLFKTTWRLPLRFITGVTRLETPLMQLLHCCTLTVHTSGRVVVLPAISEGVAIQLTALLQQEGSL